VEGPPPWSHLWLSAALSVNCWGVAGLGLALVGCGGLTYAPTATVRPTIATQPSNQAVSTGQTATFAVVAAGTTPLSYQWQKNNVDIAGSNFAHLHDAGDDCIGQWGHIRRGRHQLSGQRHQRLGNFDRKRLLSHHHHNAAGQPIRDHAVKLRHSP